MTRGLSDMTKSLLTSTDGGGPWVSGAYWTFLIISFTELLSDEQRRDQSGFFFFLSGQLGLTSFAL